MNQQPHTMISQGNQSSQPIRSGKSQIEAVMSEGVVFAAPDQSVKSLIEMFERVHCSGVPVQDKNGQWVGVVSKTDIASSKLVKQLAEGKTLDTLMVSEIMSQRLPETVPLSGTIFEAVSKMQEHRIHRVFVQNEDGEVVGVISSFDVVKLIRRRQQATE